MGEESSWRKNDLTGRAGKVNRHIFQKQCRGSLTVETAYMMPVVGLLLISSVLALFYFHDKNIISSCAYETAVIGSTKAREDEGVSSDILIQAFKERVRGKCILFPDADAEVNVGEAHVAVRAYSQRKGIKVSVSHTVSITEPERYIRDLQKIVG